MSFRRYPGYKDSSISWIGSIPSEWQVRKISHSFGSVGSGTTPSTSDEKWFSQGEIPWVTTGELRENTIDRTKKYLIPEALEAFSALQIHPKGALVIAMYGATIGRLGVLGIPATTNQACCALSQPKSLDIRFTFYWLLVHREPIVSLFSSGGGQPNINRETVTNLRVPAPKLNEQTQIARFLDHETAKIDTLIHEQKRLIELLKEKRQAVISHAVTKGLDPDVPMKDSGVEWLGEVPAHWSVMALKWRTRAKSGDSLSANLVESERSKTTPIPVIGGNGILGFCDKNNIVPPVIVLGRVGALCGNVHKVLEAAWVSDNALILEVQEKDFDLNYLNLVLGARDLNEIADKTAQPLITSSKVRNEHFPMPSKSEQSTIAGFVSEQVDRFETLIEAAKKSVILLNERRSALISAAVTGKIDVRSWQPPADERAFEEVVHDGQEATV